MSDERNETADDGIDPTVRQAYRELATERSPAVLDERILKRATTAAKPRYARTIRWLRPAAWAATIALSLSLVLEYTLGPQLVDDPALEQVGPLVKPAAEAPAGRREGDFDQRILEDQAEPAEVQRAAPERVLEEVTVNGNLPVLEKKASEPPMTAEPALATDAAVPATAPAESVRDAARKAEDVELLGEAERRLRQQRSADREDSGTSASFFSLQSGAIDAMQAEDRGCSADDTASADAWRACIARLEEQGESQLAELERGLFELAYPDADQP